MEKQYGKTSNIQTFRPCRTRRGKIVPATRRGQVEIRRTEAEDSRDPTRWRRDAAATRRRDACATGLGSRESIFCW
jgi:hypothetical protein